MGVNKENELSEKFQNFISKHPVYIKVSSFLDEGTSSLVRFEDDDKDYEWLKEDGRSICRPGHPHDPYFYFKFSTGSIEYLSDIQNSDIGEFITRLFECILTNDPSKRIDFKIISSYRRLIKSGHINLVLKSGPKTMRLAAKHGIKSIGDLARRMKDFMD